MLKENETYLDSINGKVAQFMATFEEISTSIINSEFVKGVVDSGSGILGFLNAEGKRNLPGFDQR